MRHLFCIIFIFVGACGPEIDPELTNIEYKITIQEKLFLVEIKHAIPAKLTRFIPDPKAYSYYRALDSNAQYQTRYEIRPQARSERVSDTYIKPGFFQTVGEGLFVCIGDSLETQKSYKITWEAPHDWKFANSFGFNRREQTFNASCRDLKRALYVGGTDFLLRDTWFGALAITGDFKYLTVPQIEKALEQNMKTVLDFWGQKNPDPYYFVSIRGTRSQKSGGTAQYQSFQLSLSNTQTGDSQLNRLITHEYFHHWNGMKINEAPAQEMDRLDILWFLEGFTDYYAYKLSETPDQETFTNIKLSELKRNYKNNKNYPNIPYVQGRRIAKKFDEKNELKHVMHEVIKRSQQNPKYYLTRANILNVICEGPYIPCDKADKILADHVDEGFSL